MVNELSASSELEECLNKEGVSYAVLGSMTSVPDRRGFTWNFRDMYNGLLVASIAQQMSPSSAVGLIHKVSFKHTTCNDEGVGRSWCSRCGCIVNQDYRYCPRCGAEFHEIGLVDG